MSCTRRSYTLSSWVTARPDIRHRLARKVIESSQRLCRHHRVLERTVSWPAGLRPLHRRHERKAAEHLLAYDGITAVLRSHRRLTK